jgi:RNA polymerase sigma factor (sigma-70 family)
LSEFDYIEPISADEEKLNEILNGLSASVKKVELELVDELLGREPTVKEAKKRGRKASKNGQKAEDSIGAIRAWAFSVPLLTVEEESSIHLEIMSLSPGSAERTRLKNLFIQSNMRLAIQMAKSFLNRGVEFEDLIQESYFALDKSVEKYDSSLGNKFSTYASLWIRQTLQRYVDDSSRAIRIPVHSASQLNKYKSLRRVEYLKGLEPKTFEHLAEEIEVKPKVLENLIAIDEIMSLDEDQEIKWKKVLVQEDDLLDQYLPKLGRREIERSFSTMPEREASILRHRFGFIDGEQKTLDAIAHEMGITRERVRQLEKKALVSLVLCEAFIKHFKPNMQLSDLSPSLVKELEAEKNRRRREALKERQSKPFLEDLSGNYFSSSYQFHDFDELEGF